MKKIALGILIFVVMFVGIAHAEQSLNISVDSKYNISVVGDPVTVSVAVSGENSAVGDATLMVRVIDFYDKVHFNKVENIRVAEGVLLREELRDLSPGYYRIRAMLMLENDKLKAEIPMAVRRPAIEEKGSPIFAMNGGRAEFLELMGIHWRRIDISWPSIEKTKGTFDFSHYEERVNDLSDNGIEMLGILNYTPDWAARVPDDFAEITDGPHKGWAHFPPRDLAEWENYVEKTILHFKDRIKYWEVWNEPYPYSMFFEGGSVQDYVDLLKVTYEKGKEVCPDCFFVGLGGTSADHAELVFQAGGFPYMDAASIHTYQPGIMPEAAIFRKNIRETFDAINKHGGGMQVWLTEAGWPTNKGMSDVWQGIHVDDQARYMVRSMVIAKADGVFKYFWYTYRNGGTDIKNFEHNQGVLYSDYTPKPAYSACVTMTTLLANSEFHSFEITDDNIYKALFSNSDNWVFVVWTTGKEKQLNVNSQLFADAGFVNMMGADMSPVKQEVLASRSPIYIFLPATLSQEQADSFLK